MIVKQQGYRCQQDYMLTLLDWGVGVVDYKRKVERLNASNEKLVLVRKRRVEASSKTLFGSPWRTTGASGNAGLSVIAVVMASAVVIISSRKFIVSASIQVLPAKFHELINK
jgi:hypothetical protein